MSLLICAEIIVAIYLLFQSASARDLTPTCLSLILLHDVLVRLGWADSWQSRIVFLAAEPFT